TRHIVVNDIPIQTCFKFHHSAPIFGNKSPFQTGQMLIRHAYYSAALDGSTPARRILDPKVSLQNTHLHFQDLPVIKHLVRLQIQPFAANWPKAKTKPVWEIYKIFIFNGFSRNFCFCTVEAPGQISAGVIKTIVAALLRRSPGSDISIAKGTDGLPVLLLIGLPTLVFDAESFHF